MRDNQKKQEKITNHWESFRMQEAGAIKERLSLPHYLRKSGGTPNYLPLSDDCERVETSQSIMQHRMLPCRSARYTRYSTKLPKVR